MGNLKFFAEAQYQAALIQLKAATQLLENINSPIQDKEPIASEWVYMQRLSDITGLSTNAIRNRIARGIWRDGVHYRHEHGKKNSRIIFNFREISSWLAGK